MIRRTKVLSKPCCIYFTILSFQMNQAEITRLVSGLRIKIGSKPRKLKNPYGPRGALESLRPCVSSLINEERIEIK